jgi:hypothetical protein
VPTTSVKIYEVPNSYVTSGTSPTISGVFVMTVTDGDLNLDSTEGADPGSSQIITVDGDPVSFYRFYYDDSITINGGSETIKTFQLTIDGTTRSFVMNDDGPNIPGADVGTSFTLDSYSNYTPITYDSVACFAAGTRIETDRGPVPVEMLTVGDVVRTLDCGLQPIRWIGRTALTRRDLLGRPHLAPIRIARGAFGAACPTRDLVVSPQHRVLLSGWPVELAYGEAQVLAPAVALVGRPGVTRETAGDGVTYVHFMFDRHQVVLSEGMPTESFLVGETIRDGMDRDQMAEILELFPDLAGLSGTTAPAARPILKVREARALAVSAA